MLFVKRYLNVFGYCLPFLGRRVLKEFSQFNSKLKTDK